MAYRQMAYVYDTLMENAPYDKWLSLTETLFKQNRLPVRSVLDLGCGTGQMTLRLAERGYEAVGVDISEDMLAYGQHQAQERKLPVQWIHQDISKLDGVSSFDAAVSYCDVMNYITTEQELKKTFERIYESLKSDGIYIFDVHALAYVEQELVNQTFADVTEDIAYIWFCMDGDTRGDMYHDLTFFIRDENNKFVRFSEEHHQCTFSIDTYLQLLKDVGFENCKVYADFELKNHFDEDKAERIFFSATKESGK